MHWGRSGVTALLFAGGLVFSGHQQVYAQEVSCQAKLLELYRAANAGTLGELENRLKSCEDYTWGFCEAAKPTSTTSSKNSWPQITFQEIDECRFNKIMEWTTYNKTERTRFFCEWDQFSGTYLKKLIAYQKSLGDGPDAPARNLENSVPAELGAELLDLRQIMDTRKFEWSETTSRTKSIENRISKVMERPDCPPEGTEEAKKKPKKRKPVTTYPGGKKGAGQNKPVAEDPPADNPENETSESSEPPGPGQLFRRVSIDAGSRYIHARLPAHRLGVISFGTNLNPLLDFTPTADGFGLDIGLNFELPVPGASDRAWVGRFGGEYGQLKGTRGSAISAFYPGQLPTYIDLTGVGGFGFNDNARVNATTTLDTIKLGGEFGYQFPLGEVVVMKPYGGVFYRHTQTNSDITLDTDFLGGTFHNTLTERLEQNQFGADLGLDFTWRVQPNLSLTFGGHLGTANTRAAFNGSDCGDASTLTPGCDRGLFFNTGVGAASNTWDVFGGIKAVLSIYALCREHPVAAAAVAIDLVTQALKESCVEIGVAGSYDFYPDQQVIRPTSLGGGAVSLSNTHTGFGSVLFGAKFRF